MGYYDESDSDSDGEYYDREVRVNRWLKNDRKSGKRKDRKRNIKKRSDSRNN